MKYKARSDSEVKNKLNILEDSQEKNYPFWNQQHLCYLKNVRQNKFFQNWKSQATSHTISVCLQRLAQIQKSIQAVISSLIRFKKTVPYINIESATTENRNTKKPWAISILVAQSWDFPSRTMPLIKRNEKIKPNTRPFKWCKTSNCDDNQYAWPYQPSLICWVLKPD